MKFDYSKIEKKINPELLEEYRQRFNNLSIKKQRELQASLCFLLIPDELKKKKREEIQKTMKYNDTIILIFAFIGVFTNILSSSLYLKSHQVTDHEGKINIELIPKETKFVLILRIITSITTILLLILLIRTYLIRLSFLKFKQKLHINSTLYSSKLLWKLILELLICSIHSPPKLNDICVTFTSTTGTNHEKYRVDIDLFLSSIIPLRVYLLIRYYSFYSPWADDHAEKICNECNTLGGMSFAIKAELKEKPYFMVGLLMLFSIFIFGYAIRNVELGFMQYKDQSNFQDWSFAWNGFWCVIITILTVGYGDFYPQTVLGRIIAVVACLWGTFLISLMVVSLTISVEFTPQEQKAYEELKKGEMYCKLKKRALEFIRYSVRLKDFPEKKEDIIDPELKVKYVKVLDQFKHSLHNFKTMREIVVSKEHEMSPENILYKLNENVSEEMESLICTSNSQVNALLEYLKLSEGIQQEIKTYVNKLDIMTKGLNDCLEDDDEFLEKDEEKEGTSEEEESKKDNKSNVHNNNNDNNDNNNDNDTSNNNDNSDNNSSNIINNEEDKKSKKENKKSNESSDLIDE